MTHGRSAGARRGPLVAIAVVAGVVAIILSALFIVLGGGEGAQGSGGHGGRESSSAPSGAPNPAAVPGQTATETAEATVSVEGEQTESDSADDGSEGPSSEEQSNSPPENREVANEQAQPALEEEASGNGESPEGGATGEPGGFDPLNKNAKPGDLTETDRERVRLAVSKFITSAYGYSGDNQTAYARGVERHVALPAFYDSPASQTVKANTEKVAQGGMQSVAKVERFEIEKTEPEKVVGTAYFVTGESYTRTGEVEGEKTRYAQKITLAPQGEIYKVRGAAKKREIGKGLP